MNANADLVETLEHSALYENYAAAFTEATGMPMALRPVETWQLPLHGKKGENPFCALMSAKSRTCAACLQMQDELVRNARESACTMTCAYGLSETAVPIKLGAEVVGYLQTGQVLKEPPTPARFNRVRQHLAEQGVTLEEGVLSDAYFQTPVVSSKKMASATHLLSVFAEHLAFKSNQLAVQAANAEPPVITRAKRYIAEHQSEELSLGQVAKAVNTSVFYFCKLFKKATGTNFTEYVSRVRLERAKNLLLNPNLRVSEIAFEVGFQSLTHFNRVFRRIVGQSPTDYRASLRLPV